MPPRPRPELAALPGAVHGGTSDPRVLDFSTGVSPLPPPDELITAIRQADLSRYPHPTALPVREALGRLHDVPPHSVVVGAGAVELIWAVARAFAGPERRGLVVRPTFSEYEQALRASGASVVTADMSPPEFHFPLGDIDAALAAAPVAVAFLCRPSNPCLTVAPAEDVTALARRWPEVLFVVDEAYLPMFDDVEGIPLRPNLVILRSLTKVFALPGLRLGYLLAPPPIAAVVQAAMPPWSVSTPAQAAGVMAAQLLPRCARVIRDRIRSLRVALRAGLLPVTGAPAGEGGPFLLYELDAAADVVGALRERGISIRHGASFNLPRHVRIGVRQESESRVLVERWRDLQG